MKRKPRFYLLLLLAQPLLFALFFYLGLLLDSLFWRGAEAAQGHGAPLFSLLLTLLGALVCLGLFLFSLVGLIVSLRRRKRQRADAE